MARKLASFEPRQRGPLHQARAGSHEGERLAGRIDSSSAAWIASRRSPARVNCKTELGSGEPRLASILDATERRTGATRDLECQRTFRFAFPAFSVRPVGAKHLRRPVAEPDVVCFGRERFSSLRTPVRNSGPSAIWNPKPTRHGLINRSARSLECVYSAFFRFVERAARPRKTGGRGQSWPDPGPTGFSVTLKAEEAVGRVRPHRLPCFAREPVFSKARIQPAQLKTMLIETPLVDRAKAQKTFLASVTGAAQFWGNHIPNALHMGGDFFPLICSGQLRSPRSKVASASSRRPHPLCGLCWGYGRLRSNPDRHARILSQERRNRPFFLEIGPFVAWGPRLSPPRVRQRY